MITDNMQGSLHPQTAMPGYKSLGQNQAWCMGMHHSGKCNRWDPASTSSSSTSALGPSSMARRMGTYQASRLEAPAQTAGCQGDSYIVTEEQNTFFHENG